MNKLHTMLKNQARYWAGQMTMLAKSLAPNHIKPVIHSKVEERGEGTFIIRTTADRRLAPDARAWEYGSGLKSRRGAKKKYIIKPKTKKLLAFYWDVATISEMEFGRPGKFTFAPDGRVTFHSVMHPGIQAANQGKGYIAPAAVEIRKRMKAKLRKDVGDAIRFELRSAFGRKR